VLPGRPGRSAHQRPPSHITFYNFSGLILPGRHCPKTSSKCSRAGRAEVHTKGPQATLHSIMFRACILREGIAQETSSKCSRVGRAEVHTKGVAVPRTLDLSWDRPGVDQIWCGPNQVWMRPGLDRIGLGKARKQSRHAQYIGNSHKCRQPRHSQSGIPRGSK
jgi:hypothetical protein